jgi:hypothetical protein
VSQRYTADSEKTSTPAHENDVVHVEFIDAAVLAPFDHDGEEDDVEVHPSLVMPPPAPILRTINKNQPQNREIRRHHGQR